MQDISGPCRSHLSSMLFLHTSLVLATTLLLVNPTNSLLCRGDNSDAGNCPMSQPKMLAHASSGSKDMDTTKIEMKVLAEGSHSEVAKPFLAVAREPGTYSRLRKLAPGLPELLDEFFKDQLVVAAFMGERNTGGYSVDLTRAADGVIRVAANAPEKGAMVAQVITSPFKVVAIPNHPWMGLEAASLWQQAMSAYRVTRGEFTISGGFAGRSEQFGLGGQIRVLREGKLATFIFDLKNSDGKKDRSLTETITGIVNDEQTTIYVMSAGSLVEVPHGNLSATGRFRDKGKTLELSFTSLPTMIADGYAGAGSIEAEAVASPPPNKSAVDKKSI